MVQEEEALRTNRDFTDFFYFYFYLFAMRLVPPDLICSSKKNQIHSNRCGTLTSFSNEVISVIRGYPGLQKISFLSHSLGGLVSRYAIAKLYEESSQENGEYRSDESKDPFPEDKFKGQIRIEPMNFITSLATP
ncbi:hypothetical protein LOK49_LG04G00444 [Camellia lanceoleosa]|uniref:Uncharacterized protein n=1 Tax=Camellia lanceoleosa TaxID=1840588 RepID=A0ACC0I3X6_9ERIC|nr:hypothetical protein LOK49_LG04G00444 [Camellia lanceoleosa]